MSKAKVAPLFDEDDEVRELGAEDFARMRPVSETDPALAAYGKRRRGERGPQKSATKVSVTLRLDREIVETFKAAGPGWQTRVNDQLRAAIGASAPAAARSPRGTGRK